MEFSYKTKRTMKYRHGLTEKSKTSSRNITLKLKDLPSISFFRTAGCVILKVLKAGLEVATKLIGSGGCLSMQGPLPEPIYLQRHYS
jgi:hypothetical protein